MPTPPAALRRVRSSVVVPFLLVAHAGLAGATTITVDHLVDDFFAGPNGTCTLREAVLAANLDTAVDTCPAGTAGADILQLPAGDHVLAMPGAGEDGAITGDLDVLDDLVIVGSPSAATTLDAALLGDRVLHVHAGATLALRDVTLAGGTLAAGLGGGVRVDGALDAARVAIVGNQASRGGGLYVAPGASANLVNVTLSGNVATDEGGAVYNEGTLDLASTTIADDDAPSGAAIANHAVDGPVEAAITPTSGLPNQLTLVLTNTTGCSSGCPSDSDSAAVLAGSFLDLEFDPQSTVVTLAGGSIAFGNISLQVPGFGNNITVSNLSIQLDSSQPAASDVVGGASGPIDVLVPVIYTATLNGETSQAPGQVQVTGNFAYDAQAGTIALTNLGGAIPTQNFSVLFYTFRLTGSLALNLSSVAGSTAAGGEVSFLASLVAGDCANDGGTLTSLGGNLESPGDTCGLTGAGDQVNVADPILGALAANGGPSPTHALGVGSPALGGAAGVACPAVDQRGVARSDGACDVGAFEAVCVDVDGDGYGLAPGIGCEQPEIDCKDDDPTVNPGAAEVPADQVDNDCDGMIDEVACGSLRRSDPGTAAPVVPVDLAFALAPLAFMAWHRKRRTAA